MNYIKKIAYLVLPLIFSVLSGCNSNSKKSNNTDNYSGSTDDDPETEYRISTYEFHISGGKLDGQTFSGSFPNDGNHGQGQFSSKVAKNLSNDEVSIRILDKKERGTYIIVDANLVLEDNGKLFPIVSPEDSFNVNGSRISFQIGENSEDMTKRHQFSSKSGTVSMSNLKLEQDLDVTKSLTTMIDCDVRFEAEFHDIEFGTGETPQALTATIKGEFHIQSIRNNK